MAIDFGSTGFFCFQYLLEIDGISNICVNEVYIVILSEGAQIWDFLPSASQKFDVAKYLDLSWLWQNVGFHNLSPMSYPMKCDPFF